MRLFGHPVHPMLVAFPVALLAMTPVWDLLALFGIMAEAKVIAYGCELAGLITAGLAIVTGFADFMKIPRSQSAATNAALVHAGLAICMVSLFGIAFALRGDGGAGSGITATPGTLALALEIGGALCLAVVGWLGGHLVFGHGVGVRADGDGSPK